MSPASIVFIIILIILITYVLVFLMNLAFINVFLKKFREHKHALNIALTEKYEIITHLISLAGKYGVKIDDSMINLYNDIKSIDFVSFESEICQKSKTSLAILKQEIISACKQNEQLVNDNEYKNFVEQLNMLDSQIRYLVVSFNADVIGYNYWIHFKPYRYIFSFLEIKEKEIK